MKEENPKPKTPEPLIDENEANAIWKTVIAHDIEKVVEMLNKHQIDAEEAQHFVGHHYYKNLKHVHADVVRRLLAVKLACDAIHRCLSMNEKEAQETKIREAFEETAKKISKETGLKVEMTQMDGGTYNRLFKKR